MLLGEDRIVEVHDVPHERAGSGNGASKLIPFVVYEEEAMVIRDPLLLAFFTVVLLLGRLHLECAKRHKARDYLGARIGIPRPEDGLLIPSWEADTRSGHERTCARTSLGKGDS